jgi:hypothetical protein
MMIAGITRKTHGWRFSFGHFKKKHREKKKKKKK